MNESNAERRWALISKYIPRNSIGAELGVFKGHFSKFLLRSEPRKLYLVDPWYRLGPHWTWVNNQDSSTLHAFQLILSTFADRINDGSVVPVPDFSTTFLASMPENSVDFVYLDSSHNYKDTVLEITLSLKALRPGGLLLGDDWHDDPTHRHSGVSKAVKETLQGGKHSVLFTPTEAQWGIQCVK